jgi:hypothetical protein
MKCADCKFWARYPTVEQIKATTVDSAAAYFEKNYRPTRGWCRINPPTLQPRESFSGMTIETKWPETHEDDFCGKFEPANDEASESAGQKTES